MRLDPKESDLRCAFCHGDLGPDPWKCPECRSLLHGECWEAAKKCPTIGCPTCHTTSMAPDTRPRRWPRHLLTAVLLGGCCFLSPCCHVGRVEIHKYRVRHCAEPAKLLTVCRKLMRETRATSDEPDEYRDERVKELPDEIRALDPGHVTVYRDRVVLGYGGGF